jgi:hypothetical protein
MPDHFMGVAAWATLLHIDRSAGASRAHKMLDRLTVGAITKCHGRPGTVDGEPEKWRGSVACEWTLA